MATLNTLRTKGGWILTVVIGVALLAFIIGDLVGRGSAFGVKEKVGKIDGESISYMDYVEKVDYVTDINKALSGRESMSTEEQDQIRNYAWDLLLNEKVVFPGLKALGIDVTDDEMFELVYGNEISPVLVNMGIFNDATGAYDKLALQEFVSTMDLDYTGTRRRIWDYIQDQVYQDALMSKYFSLLNHMSFVNDQEAATAVSRANATYNVRLVGQDYTTIPDSVVKVSSSDIRKYYDAHKEQYKQVASRQMEYIVFEVLPSEQDYADAKEYVNQLADEFKEAEDVELYVTLNSHEAFNPMYFSQDQLTGEMADFAFVPENIGDIYGPVLENNVYTITRISDIRTFSDTIGLRQMAFAPGDEALADSVFAALKKGSDFNTLAEEHSIIPMESSDMGRISTQYIPMEVGESIFFTRDQFVKFESPNGVTILFDVYHRGPESKKAQLASVVYHIEPSAATQQAAYAEASGFYTATAGVRANFDKEAADKGYMKRTARVQAGQTQISGLDNAREMARWAFNNKVGNISNIMEIDDNYVVAVLTSAAEAGYTPVDEVSISISSILRQEKKADMLAEKMKGASSLDALAGTLSAKVEEIDDVNYNTFYIPEVGFEPALIGAICGGISEGQISKPIKGMSGVYVVEITSKNVSDETTEEMERARLQAQGEYGIAQRTIGALQQKSNVVDDRSRYF